MRPKSSRSFALRRHAVALAALSLFLGASGQALAAPPYYDYSGSVHTSPNNLLPFDVNTALLDLSGNTLDVGGGAAGSFSALAGAHLIADTLRFGLGLGNGSGSISGAGTVATLLGRGSLEVGSWGTGSLMVSAGAVLDATTNPSACTTSPDGCYSFVGNAAGSTANLTVTGAKSQLNALGNFIVGSANVYTPASSGFAFGTPGGVTQASVNVLDGGSMHTQSVIVSTGPAGPGPTGSEHTSATVTIDGSGSQWIVTPNSIGGGQARFNTSQQANAQSAITVSNSGLLQLDGSAGGVGSSLWLGNGGVSTLTVESGGTISVGGATGSNGSFVGIGSGPTGSATVTVTGAGSQFNLTGTHAGMSVGAGSGGFGRLDITNGGAVTVGNFSIGSRSTGVVNVSGGTLQMNGTDGRLLLGDWGTGTLNISGGGIVDATLAPANCVGNWCGNFVGNLAGSTATLTIDGAGSELRLLRGASIANVYVNGGGGTVGGTSTATIAVTNGGSLRSSNVTTGDGINWTGFAGDGSEQSVAHITIDGAGSQWIAQPNALDGGGVGFNLSSSANALSVMTLSNGGTLKIDSSATGSGANLTVGNNGGTATMSVRSGAQVAVGGATGSNGSDFGIGVGQGSVGVVTLAGAGSAIGITGAHANTAVGSGGGTGQFKVVGGATLATGGLTVGTWHGTGVMNVDGSSVQIDGSDGRLLVGDWGTGSLAIRNGGTIDATLVPANCGNGNWCGNVIGNRAGSIGSLTIDGAGSRLNVLRNLDVASVWVDAYGGTAGGLSTGTIAISNGGALYSNGVNVGAGAGGSNFTGNGKEASIAHITIDGSGSKWIATSNTLDSQGVWFNLANFALAQSFMTLSNGALLKVDSSANNLWSSLTVGNGGQAALGVLSGAQVEVGGAAGNNGSNLNVGWGPGSSGSVAVSGAGSSIALSGSHANMNLGWGDGASGQMTVTNGGTVTAGGLTIGQNQGTGFVNVNGGTLLLNGTDGRLLVGDTGNGTLTVTGGGLVDATLNLPACNGNWCGNEIGANAGSTGTLTVSGVGSRVRTSRLIVANDTVGSAGYGISGGVSTGTVNVLNGGTLATQSVSFGANFPGAGSSDTETSVATGIVSGAGSKWNSSVDATGSNISFIVGQGSGATGSISVSDHGSLVFDASGAAAGSFNTFMVGQGGGHGTMDITANGLVQLRNSGAAVGGGAGSIGVLSISSGGKLVLDNAGSTPWSIVIGQSGGQGTLNIGAGGSAELLNAGIGIGGATGGNGTLSITNGGTLSSTGGGVANGSGPVTGTVIIDGPDSSWTIARDLASGGGQAGLNIAPVSNAVGSLTLSNGATLAVHGVRANPATDSSIPFIALAYGANSTATLNVGIGSAVTFSGDTGALIVGGSNSQASNAATALLNITGGATVESTGSNGLVYVAVGRNQANGILTVDGVGSKLKVAGVGGTNTQGLDGTGGLVDVGRNRGFGGGTGALNVTNAGSVFISDNGNVASTGSMGLRIAQGVDTTGTVNVSGSGSSIVVSSTSGDTATKPYVHIGSGGVGQMTIGDGGSVSVLGSGQRDFIVGNASTGSGTLDVKTGGQINASWFAVGNNGGSGTATIDASTVNLDGVVYFNGAPLGAGVRVGRGVGANGTLNLRNGAVVNIDNSLANSSVLLGGTGSLAGGNGTLNLSGGSAINFTGPAAGASLQVGTVSGTGTMSMTGNSVVDLGVSGQVFVGRNAGTSGSLTIASGSAIHVPGGDVIIAGQPGSTGTLTLDSASVVNASYVGVGANHGTAGGDGTLKVNDGGTVNTTTLEIGPHGVLTGDGGIINAAGDVIVNGMILPGDAPGRITINCNLIANQGSSLVIGIQATPAGYLVGELVFGSDAQLNLANLDIHFNFIGTTDPNAFVATGRFNLDSFIETQSAGGTIAGLSTTFAPGESWSTVLANSKLSASADAYDIVSQPVLGSSGALNVVAVPVPEPETWALWLGGIALMAAWMRRQRAARGAG